MYEQQVPVARRVLWIALWAILILAVLAVAIWLIFFRGADQKSQPIGKSNQPSQQTKQTPATNDSDKQTADNDNKAQTPQSADKPATGQTPAATTSLANTGSGDVITPAVIVAIAGGASYQLYLRRKAV